MNIIDGYLEDAAEALRDLPRAEVARAVDLLHDAYVREATVYIVGNGGSAATASHLMNDLTKLTRAGGRPPFRALALTDAVPLITAWANDSDYAEVFAEQLQTFGRAGDVLVAISTSGTSPNVVRAAEVARALGLAVIALTGPTGGRLTAISDVCVRVPHPDIGHQEDVHLVLCHALAYAVRAHVREGGDVLRRRAAARHGVA